MLVRLICRSVFDGRVVSTFLQDSGCVLFRERDDLIIAQRHGTEQATSRQGVFDSWGADLQILLALEGSAVIFGFGPAGSKHVNGGLKHLRRRRTPFARLDAGLSLRES